MVKIKNLLKIVQFLSLFIEDIVILLGAVLIIKATFILNHVGGLYITGLFLLLFGLLIARKPKERR